VIDAEARLGRVVVRARHLGWRDDAVRDLAAALRGGEATEVLRDAVAATAPRAAGGMLALALGGGDEDPDDPERAALALAAPRAEVLDALLDQADAAAPCWPGALRWLRAAGVSEPALFAALLRRAAVWVSLDGALAAVGRALRAELSADPPTRVPALLRAAGDAGPVVVTRCVRALGAAVPRDDATVRAFAAALPPGLRGAVADGLLALGGERFQDDVVAVARGERGATEGDAVAALEALLRQLPAAAAPFAEAVLDATSTAPSSLRAEMLRVHGAGDPARWAPLAATLAAQDPGEWAAALAGGWPADVARPLWESLLRAPSGALATRAAEALLATPHPGRGALAAALLRDPGAASREAVLLACAKLGDDELGAIVALLEDRASEIRVLAVRALHGRGEVAAEALAARHGEERAPRVRAAIVSALGFEPRDGAGSDAGDPLRAAVVARAEAGRVGAGKKPSRWLERCDATLRWDDGTEVPRSVPQHLVRLQSLRGGAEPDPEVVEVARMLHPSDRESWAEAMLDAWIAADAPAGDHGALLLATLLGGALASRALGEAIPLWHRGSRRSLAASAAQLLAMRAADHGLCVLDDLASRHPHESFGAAARHALDEEARARGAPVEQMLDGAAPGYDLDGGARRFDLGHHAVRVEVRGAEVILRDDEGGVLHAPPRPSKRDDPERVTALRRALRVLHQTLPDAVSRETARLVDAMASARVFPGAHLRVCLGHAVLGPLCRRLWWRDDAHARRGDDLGDLDDDRGYVLLHALDGLVDDDLPGAPFAQARRPAVALPPEDRDAPSWQGLAGRWLVARGERHARAVPPWTAAGWTPGTVEDGRCHAFSLRFNSARVEAVLEVQGIALWSEQERRTAVGSLRFTRWDDPAALALGSLPPTLFSEAVTRAEAMLL
jgi:hypothetical protein